MQEKTEETSKIGTFRKLLLSANAKKVLELCKIDGYAPDNKERIGILYQRVVNQKIEKEIKMLLEQSFATLKAQPGDLAKSLDIIQMEVLCAHLKRIVNYTVDFLEIDKFCAKTKQLEDLIFTSERDLEKIMDVIASSVAKFELGELEKLFSGWVLALENTAEEKIHPVVSKIMDAIQRRNSTGFKESSDELIALYDKNKDLLGYLNYQKM